MVFVNYTISARKICQGSLALLAMHLDKSDLELFQNEYSYFVISS
jgi:hypothetical protein